MSTNSLSAILLSAGESTRMGRSKATLPWLGETLIKHQISSLLDAGCAPVVIVLGHRPGLLEPLIPEDDRLEVVVNPHYREGKTTSIKAGLRLMGDGLGVLVLAVDQPRPIELLKLLVAEHLTKDPLITAPFHQGKAGHPVIFSRVLFPELRKITEHTMGLRGIMERHQARVNRIMVDTPVIHLDMNRQEDYLHAMASDDGARSFPQP